MHLCGRCRGGDFVRADYPSAGLLWRRLSGGTSRLDYFGGYIKDGEGSVIPGCYKKLVERRKALQEKIAVGIPLSVDEEEEFCLKPFASKETEGVDRYGYAHFAFECFPEEANKFENILRSRGFWKSVLGDGFYYALIVETGRWGMDGELLLDMPARLAFSADCERLEKGQCDISVWEPKVAEKVIYDVNLAQKHRKKLNTGTEEIGRKVTDFAINLRLVVNMVTEEIEEVWIRDKFIVNKPLANFGEEGRCVFKKVSVKK